MDQATKPKRNYTLSEAACAQRQVNGARKKALNGLPELFHRLNMCSDEAARLEHAGYQIGQLFTLKALIQIVPRFKSELDDMHSTFDAKRTRDLQTKLRDAQAEISMLNKCLHTAEDEAAVLNTRLAIQEADERISIDGESDYEVVSD